MRVLIDDVSYVPKRCCCTNELISLGEMLKSLRTGTLDEVALEVDISKTYLWELENGKSKSPSFAIVARLARHYGVSLDDLANSVILE